MLKINEDEIFNELNKNIKLLYNGEDCGKNLKICYFGDKDKILKFSLTN